MIYLASKSPRRALLLNQIGVEFEILSVDVDESQRVAEPPEQYTSRMAQAKTQAGERLLVDTGVSSAVLAADTIITIDGKIVGKPDDEHHCRSILALLSGRQHQVLSAVVLRFAGQTSLKLSANLVNFRKLEEWEIVAYCAGEEPVDKAGSYAIQGKAAAFIERIEGSYSSIMGLPLFETAELLKQAKISVLSP